MRHEDGLCAIESEVIRDNIKSVQITESDCVVTLKDQICKERLLAKGIEIKNRYVKFVDVDKQLTNITIKDLPYELTDQFLATHPAKFGQVVDGSIKRGYIRETTIENGTRYAQLLNCIPLIPNRTSFGNVRIFADNNRTSYTYCGRTDHPSFRCKDKPDQQRVCYNCNERGHTVKQCKQSTICNYCKKKRDISGVHVTNTKWIRCDRIMETILPTS